MTPKPKKPLMGQMRPRLHTPLLKSKNRIDEVKQIAELIEMPLLPWQEFVLKDMTSIDKDNNWIRKSNLVIVARQSGKTHLARMRILAGMYAFGEKNLLMMAQSRSMALVTFREIVYAIENSDELRKQVKQVRFSNGQESVELKNGCRLDVLASTRESSRGRSADFLYIDELREISTEAFKAASPTTRARANSQSLYTSNAGDAFSETLNNMRERALDAPPKTFGFYEYSAPQFCKIDDRKAWAMANPALGYTVTEEAIEEAIATSSIEATRTETLCQWIDSLSSPFPHGSLEATSDKTLKLSPGAFTVFAFDVSPSRRYASLVAGQILPDGKLGVGILEQWHSQVSVDDVKIAAGIKAWYDIFNPRLVCYDKYATESIAQKLGHAGVPIEDVSGVHFYQACGDLLNAITSDQFRHNGQEEFVSQMFNVAAKENDSGWRIVKRKSAGDISAPISAAMIIHQLVKPQTVPRIFAV
jgi:phage terminase large subunit-like protein